MSKHYIEDYLDYAAQNEAPRMFHVWSGYVTLSAAIGRRCWLVRGENVVYPNIYVLLNGAAGGGKSTALRNARRLIAELGTIPMSASVETPEGLCRFMGGRPDNDPPIISPCQLPLMWPDGVLRNTHQLVIFANEFIDFISKNQEGWTSMLNNIYDEDRYDYRTKGQGEDILDGPYLVLLGAIPTEISKKLQREEIITTGFARRTFMQYGERMFHAPKCDPIFTDEEKAARARCLARLKHIQTLKGPMFRTPAAAKWWKEWYDDHSITLMKRATPATQGWLSSKPDQVIKLAILNSLAERDDLYIEPEHYQRGLDHINEMEKDHHKVFGSIGRNELAPVAVKILEYLTSINEPIDAENLQTKFFHAFAPGKGSVELDEILKYLCATGQIVKHEVKHKKFNVSTWAYITPEGLKKFLDESGPGPDGGPHT